MKDATKTLTYLWKIIVHPGAVWRELEKDNRILLPVLIILSLNVFMVCIILPETKNYTANILTQQGMSSELIRQSLTGISITMILGALLAPLFTWVIHAALLTIFNHYKTVKASFREVFPSGSYIWLVVFMIDVITTALISKREDFKRFFKVAFYAWIPVFLGGFIKKILIKIMAYETVLSLRTSAAILLPMDRNSGFVFAFLNYMDIFTIWGLCLLVIGGAAIMKNHKKELALYIFILWFIYIILKSIFNVWIT